jgi:hypothetical protein
MGTKDLSLLLTSLFLIVLAHFQMYMLILYNSLFLLIFSSLTIFFVVHLHTKSTFPHSSHLYSEIAY